MTENELYQAAMALFEKNKYKECLEILTGLFGLGFYHDEILEFIYACFITPNQKEFQSNYRDNGENSGYEACEWDFVPVSDTEFFPYYKTGDIFLSCLDFSSVEDCSNVFSSAVVCAHEDYEVLFQALRKKQWRRLYIISNTAKSFLHSANKIAGAYTLFENTQVFEDVDDFISYMRREKMEYLPRYAYGDDAETIQGLLQEIHKERITAPYTKQGNVFLSICIPSYNRGALALRGVRHILSLGYDREIEIVVVNDASDKGVEQYQELAELQDARFCYYENTDNLGLAGNVAKVLQQATGQFAVVCADEDMMVLDHLEEYLDILYQNQDAGMVVSTGYGEEFRLLTGEFQRYEKGLMALNYMLRLNYITGWTLNMNLARQRDFFGIFNSLRGNHFLEYFPQMAFAMFASDVADMVFSGVALFDERYGDNQTYVGNDGSKLFYYVRPESRSLQIQGCAEIVANNMNISMDERGIFLSILMVGFYKLAYTNARLLWRFREEYSWPMVVEYLHAHNQELLASNLMGLDDFMMEYVRAEEEKAYQEYVAQNPEEHTE